jgi:hypothetical protein
MLLSPYRRLFSAALAFLVDRSFLAESVAFYEMNRRQGNRAPPPSAQSPPHVTY